ncbi:cytochrome c [Longimicrobium sp.]|uniref:c-type cytochrome n=1 Tax=Longimicrobium sp. TaxID=2029185 RepID=UPI002E2F983D|nr:cytochrome c [Longimicrobium sp.]HEX6037974.1 cytochrome c [Longimicrobium sp.]
MTSANLARAAALGAAVLALSACTDWAGYDLDRAAGKVPAFSTMRNDVSPDPYQMVREPVPGTVPALHPLGDVPERYSQTQLDSVAALLSNPLQPTPQVLARGQRVYEANCAVCHGPEGAGNGPVVDANNKFPFAPAINGAATAARSDGYVYAVIDAGRNFMPPYGARITHADRWAVVTYVRHLEQRAGTPATSPIPQASAGGAALDAGTVPPSAEPQPSAGTPPATMENRPSSTVP